jgi:hypothetical protein
MEIKVRDIMDLIETYGKKCTLQDILKDVQAGGMLYYKCPKCYGEGALRVKYNAYPSGLPDSGWVEDWQYKSVECDLCKGEGYTDKEYRPKMVQDGWEC